MNGTLTRVGTAGSINGYHITVLGDAIAIDRDGKRIARRTVDGLARFVAGARDLKLGWGQFPDDSEVIYLYDKGDSNFG